MEKSALIVVTSNDRLGNSGKTGWFLSEVSHVYYPLKEAGFQISFASPQGGTAPLEAASLKLEDPLNKRFVHEFKVKDGIDTFLISEINPDDFDVIYFAGGHGTMWDFPEDEDIPKLTAYIYEKGGIVAAVCHGPSALVNVKLSTGKCLVEGKEVNSFTNAEEKEVGKEEVVPFLLESKLRERGAKFVSGNNWEDKVVVSERLITGQNPQSALSLGKKIVEVYEKLSKGTGRTATDSEATGIWPS